MLKRDVRVGGHYLAKVSDKVQIIRLTSESRYGGWDAVNVRTGRVIRIRSAAKLRAEVRN